jgi:hypothetical protein
MIHRRIAIAVALTFAFVVARPLRADDAAPEDAKTESRRLFAEGVDGVKRLQYGDALVRFEKAYALYPFAVTSLNIGICERALGHYVRARIAFVRALSEHEAAGGTALSQSSVEDARAFLKEIDGLLSKTKVSIRPAEATIAVDGRPLSSMDLSGSAVQAAGVAPAGPGQVAPSGNFDLVLDPGSHVFVVSRKGFSDAVVNRVMKPGDNGELLLELATLPATIRVSSAVKGAIVKVGKSDVGPTPVDVLRPAGTYPLVVQKEGFVDYETSLSVKAGEEAKIDAVLVETKMNVAEQWWFWTSIAAAAGTVGLVTYFATRPEPDPAPYNGGTSGWVAQPSVIRF